jgi:hypothetical protein
MMNVNSDGYFLGQRVNPTAADLLLPPGGRKKQRLSHVRRAQGLSSHLVKCCTDGHLNVLHKKTLIQLTSVLCYYVY